MIHISFVLFSFLSVSYVFVTFLVDLEGAIWHSIQVIGQYRNTNYIHIFVKAGPVLND